MKNNNRKLQRFVDNNANANKMTRTVGVNIFKRLYSMDYVLYILHKKLFPIQTEIQVNIKTGIQKYM